MSMLRDLRAVERSLDIDERALEFARYVACLAYNNGRTVATQHDFAERYPHSNYRDIIQKADPMSPDPTASPDVGGYHLSVPALSSAFLEYTRPATILGRLIGARRAPFNVKVPRAVGGVTADWVGAGAPKPVSEGAFDTIELRPSKVSGIVVLTRELVRLSNDVATTRIAQDLAAAAAQLLDETFLSDDAAAADSPAYSGRCL
jgi:HK97 family phage major capsid protein